MNSYLDILQRTWPLVLANAAVPLLGLADTAVIGNFGSLADLGAIALGALVFSFVYWGFGFLRMGTTGFVARADGAKDATEVRAVFGSALLLALLLGLLLVLMQWPIRTTAFSLIGASSDVESLAMDYFSTRIWGAPATLATFVLMGLLIGLGESKALLRLQLLLNGLNIALDCYFAGVLALGAWGIALGTVMAEWITVVIAIVLVVNRLRRTTQPTQQFWPWARILDRTAMLRLISANFDIMIRTLLLVFSFAFFTNRSAIFGDVTLAANHILLQLVSFSAFFLDGFAFTVESLVGNAYGAKDRYAFVTAVKQTSILALIAAVFLALLIYLFGFIAVNLLTDLPQVRMASSELIVLAALYVLLSFMAFQLDGIFIGLSFTREMRNAAIYSLAIYLLTCALLIDEWGVVGLWRAMVIYVVARALTLLRYYPGILRRFDSP